MGVILNIVFLLFFQFYINPFDIRNISDSINKIIIEIKNDKSQFNLVSKLKSFQINTIHDRMLDIYSKF